MSYNISDYLGSDEVLGSYLDANRAVDTARTMAKSSALIRVQRASTATFHETVRIEPLGGSSFANEVRGDVAKVGSVQVIVVGYKDHPDYADTNILRGDRFVIVDDEVSDIPANAQWYRVVQLMPQIEGRLQAVAYAET